jgi:hypothetical protein
MLFLYRQLNTQAYKTNVSKTQKGSAQEIKSKEGLLL